ncbi:replication initiator protein [Capybara microvirus Cap1_SP_145]|nr:replication initiator protein [Capybara microvirus Cap1_SP_145]
MGSGLHRVNTVPCGKCVACRSNKREEWASRLAMEYYTTFKKGFETFFITLTFNDENLQNPSLDKRDIQLFNKKFRHYLSYKYFFCGEYGDKFDRKHYHALIFCNTVVTPEYFTRSLEKCWPYGFVKADNFTYARARYVAKYALKDDNWSDTNLSPPFALMSTKPAICYDYVKLFHNQIYDGQSLFYCDSVGYHRLPRYVKEKIFSKIWLREQNDAYSRLEFNKELYVLRNLQLLHGGNHNAVNSAYRAYMYQKYKSPEVNYFSNKYIYSRFKNNF